MKDYPITTTVKIDGVEAYATAADLGDGHPTVMDGLTLQWGRSSLADQPDAGTCSFTVREQITDGISTIAQVARVGASVEVWARADDGTTGADTQKWSLDDYPVAGDLPTTLWAQDPAEPVDTVRTSGLARVRQPGQSNWSSAIVFPPDHFSVTTGAWNHVQRILPGQTWHVSMNVRIPVGATGYLHVMVSSSANKDAPMTVAPSSAAAIPGDGQVRRLEGTVTLPKIWDDPDGAWILPGVFVTGVPLNGYFEVDQIHTVPTSQTVRDVLVWAGEIATVTLSPQGDNAVLATVTCVDLAASLANTTIGDEPWPVQPIADRTVRIVDLAEDASHRRFDLLIDEPLKSVRVQERDVDSQPAHGLLLDLASSAGAALWPAASASRGPYLWMEDPQARRSSRVLSVAADGTAVIVPAPDGAVTKVTAGDILRDPVSWAQDPASVSTSVDVVWPQAFGRDPESGQLNTVERTVTRTDPDLLDQFGLRKLSVTTELAYAGDAAVLASQLLLQAAGTAWRFDGLAIDTGVLDRAPLPGGPTQTERLTLVLDLLDGARRIGKALIIPDMPVWTPGGTDMALFVEGGTYTLNGSQWQLELRASPATGQGHSVTWNEVPEDLSWDDMAGITWDDLHGVGI